MKDRDQKNVGSILGDINPRPQQPSGRGDEHIKEDPQHRHDDNDNDDDMARPDSSRDDASEHSGSRDVRTGGTGTVAGGSRNYRSGSGATGSDIGNRPE